MATLDEALAQAQAEANEVFGRLAKLVEGAAKGGRAIHVLEVARKAGLEIDERELAARRIPILIHVLPWLPWHYWFPWRPFWCYWWERRFPYHGCCPYWWHGCHPHAYPC